MMRATFALLLLLATSASMAADDFRLGRHYEAINPPVERETPGEQVEVVEMFWYGCPHCYQFEPVLESWIEHKPDNVEFIRVPAVFARNWEVHARAYYAAEQLGILDKTHSALFDALHKERRKLFDEDTLAAFYAGFGVTEAAFHEAYNSFDVDKKVRHAIALTRKYGIGGVPSIIVNGAYRSGTQAAGTYEDLLKITDFLVAKEAKR